MNHLKELESIIVKEANPSKAKILARFFKTGKGEYGEGDVFLGIQVPRQREIAGKFLDLGLKDIQELLNSKIHEKRLVALLILIEKYKKNDNKKEILDFYLRNTGRINNWDLVDLSCHKIVGDYLVDRPREILYKLAKSRNLWERRIAVISTFAFIREDEFSDSLRIAEILLEDKEDLIHKAVGWMLREIGKKDEKKLEEFLNRHCSRMPESSPNSKLKNKKANWKMPRTMLRYAIERLDEKKRQSYLTRDI